MAARLIHFLHTIHEPAHRIFRISFILFSHSLQVAAVATLNTQQAARRRAQAAAGQSQTHQAGDGDTGDSESNDNRESHFALRSARRPEGLPENATWQQCGPATGPHGPFYGFSG